MSFSTLDFLYDQKIPDRQRTRLVLCNLLR